MIDEVACTLHVVLREAVERGTFLEILPQEPVGVLDGAFLPGVVRPGEEAVGLEDGGDDVVAGELASVVEGEGFDDAFERQQPLDDGVADDRGFERRHELRPEEPCRSFEHGDEVAGTAAADHGVDFDVAQT